MKVTTSQLRRIIRKSLISESKQYKYRSQDQLYQILTRQFPEIAEYLESKNAQDYGSHRWETIFEFLNSKTMKPYKRLKAIILKTIRRYQGARTSDIVELVQNKYGDKYLEELIVVVMLTMTKKSEYTWKHHGVVGSGDENASDFLWTDIPSLGPVSNRQTIDNHWYIWGSRMQTQRQKQIEKQQSGTGISSDFKLDYWDPEKDPEHQPKRSDRHWELD